MLRRRRNLIRVPKDLATVTRVDQSAETDPASLGLSDKGLRRIWTSVEHLYRTGTQPFISLGIWRQGQCVMKRSIGHTRGNAPGDPADGRAVVGSPDTPVCLFSASKAVTAMLVHKMVEEKRLTLSDPVVDYLPEFGQRGKQHVTILDLLSHRAGIPRIPSKHADPALLFDWDKAVQVLCEARPIRGIGQQQAYHAITAGFILGELIQRVTGQDLRKVLSQRFTQPLGLNHMSYGLPLQQHALAAENAFTGPALVPPLGYIAKRILGARFEDVAAISNDPRFLSATIPAGNLYASADDACLFFQMLLNGGELNGTRVLEPETIARAVAPIGHIRPDSSLLLPVRFSAGMVSGERLLGLYGLNCAEAYGHLGFINIICWADPARDISVALLNTGKSMAVDGVTRLAQLVGAISKHCPRH